jgi:FixJ family two-component response regulator
MEKPEPENVLSLMCKLAYDVYRINNNNKDLKGDDMKQYEDVSEQEKKVWSEIVNVIVEFFVKTIEMNKLNNSLGETIKVVGDKVKEFKK